MSNVLEIFSNQYLHLNKEITHLVITVDSLVPSSLRSLSLRKYLLKIYKMLNFIFL